MGAAWNVTGGPLPSLEDTATIGGLRFCPTSRQPAALQKHIAAQRDSPPRRRFDVYRK